MSIPTWSELHDRLFFESWNEELGRHRSDYAFRGCWDAEDDLSGAPLRDVEKERHDLSPWVARYYPPRRR